MPSSKTIRAAFWPVFVNRKSTHLIIEKVPSWGVGDNKLIVRKVPG
jgi:hypothetical protein